jgi:hypothetical protein
MGTGLDYVDGPLVQSHVTLYKPETEADFTRPEERVMWQCSRERFEDVGLEDWSDVPQIQKCWQPPEGGRGEEWTPLESLKEICPADTFISTQWDWMQTSGLQSCERFK